MIKFVQDITADIGELFSRHDKVVYPMYSYNRPAYTFWQGAYDAMRRAGKTHEQAIDVLQSKAPRWMLDQNDHLVYNLGKRMAKKMMALYP